MRSPTLVRKREEKNGGGFKTRPNLFSIFHVSYGAYLTDGSTSPVNLFNCSAWYGEANRTMK